jgi:hypothetical protein
MLQVTVRLNAYIEICTSVGECVFYVYCNGFDQSIARQRLSKHVPKHVPCNNMVEMFSMWSAPCLMLGSEPINTHS